MTKEVARERRRGRPASGSLRWRGGQWWAQITLRDGSRPVVELDPSIPREDRTAARACAREVSDYARTNGVVPSRIKETVGEWTMRWLAARKERGLASVADDRSRLRHHVLVRLGPKDVRRVSRSDIEDLVEDLDTKVRAKTISWKTASHAWGLVTRMFADACGAKRRDLRVREDNPALNVHGPERGALRSKVYLYPSEVDALLSCSDVPLRWRRMFAITTYLYARAGEINALTWDDVDLERGIVHIHRSADRRTGEVKSTKTKTARRVPIDPALRPLLEAMHADSKGEGRVSPVHETDKKLSRQLRRCLELADVKRAELFAADETRKPLTFHDLRGTGITWCAVRGDDPLKIKQRAGHSTFSTTEGYIREAENLRETNFGQPFGPLPASLLGTKARPTAASRISQPISQRSETQVTIAPKNRAQKWRRRESTRGVRSPRSGRSTPRADDRRSRAVAEGHKQRWRRRESKSHGEPRQNAAEPPENAPSVAIDSRPPTAADADEQPADHTSDAAIRRAAMLALQEGDDVKASTLIALLTRPLASVVVLPGGKRAR